MREKLSATGTQVNPQKYCVGPVSAAIPAKLREQLSGTFPLERLQGTQLEQIRQEGPFDQHRCMKAVTKESRI